MKRFLLIIILAFPVMTLSYWVYRGVHTPKSPDATTGKPSQTNLPEQGPGTNSTNGTNPVRKTNTWKSNEPPAN